MSAKSCYQPSKEELKIASTLSTESLEELLIDRLMMRWKNGRHDFHLAEVIDESTGLAVGGILEVLVNRREAKQGDSHGLRFIPRAEHNGWDR